MSYEEDLAAYRRALDDAGQLLAGIAAADWTAATPCTGWDVAALVTHVIGQNRGFARAVSTADADAAAYVITPPPFGEALAVWRASAAQVVEAFAGADRRAGVCLVEVDPHRLIPVGQVLRMHLLDIAVHSWDLAVALGADYRPDADIVDRVLAIAEQVPTGASRERPGAAFAPARVEDGGDPWADALALLGRAPGAAA